MRFSTIFVSFLFTVLFAIALNGCTKLDAGDTFTVKSDGIVFQYEVIVSRMNYVRVIPVSGDLSGSVTIPPTVTYNGEKYVVTQIGENAFRGCESITSVNLPNTITIIGASAFFDCSSLETINTPQPLSEIGDFAFYGCTSLKNFSLDASISVLGKGCFRECTALQSVKFSSSITEIPDEAFFGCFSLESIHCPATVLRIGNDAFGSCVKVKEIYLDRSVQSIGEGAFAGCGSVESMTCLTATPPACSANTFEGIRPDIPITVMMSSAENYSKTAHWNYFSNYKGTY